MSSGLPGLPPVAWSWWHQQGSPMKLPVHLRRNFTKDVMKHFLHAKMLWHSGILASVSCRVWNGYSCIVWCDKSIVYTGGSVDGDKTNKKETKMYFFGLEMTHGLIKSYCLDAQRPWAFQLYVTCNSSSSEQLQCPHPSILICQLLLGVGINREVDGRKGDVTQEASFGSLIEKKIM